MRVAQKKPEEYMLPREYVKLGMFLQKNRIKANLTQREVSLKLGYSSAQFISNFERGISSPPIKKMKELIKLYKMQPKKVINLQMNAERSILTKALTI